MKKYLLLFVMGKVLIYINTYSQYSSVTIYTPKGDEISAEALTDTAYDYSQTQKDSIKDYWLRRYNYRITFIAEATREYNCHGYAWSVSEGGDTVVIKTPNDDIYWTEESYREISPETNAKVAFLETADHSAIRTSQTNILISKWGYVCRFRHHVNDCPYTPKTGLKYYKLDPHMTGSTSALCYNVQRTFDTDITHMPPGTLTWTKGPYITYYSGAGTPHYTVKGGDNGSSYVKLQISTPSGFTWSNYKYFWSGKPIITNQKVDGSYYYPGFQICPGDHYLSVTPVGDGAGTATWTVPPGIVYWVGYNTLDFTFPSSWSSISISVRSANTCGTGPNWYFYLTKKTYGCYGSYAMNLFPNPASDNVTITMDEITSLSAIGDSCYTDMKKAESAETTTFVIRIFDRQSILVFTATRTGSSFTIPLNNLQDGIYIIEVSDGENVCRQQLTINRY